MCSSKPNSSHFFFTLSTDNSSAISPPTKDPKPAPIAVMNSFEKYIFVIKVLGSIWLAIYGIQKIIKSKDYIEDIYSDKNILKNVILTTLFLTLDILSSIIAPAAKACPPLPSATKYK